MSAESPERYPEFPATNPEEESEHVTGPLEVPTEKEPGTAKVGADDVEQHE